MRHTTTTLATKLSCTLLCGLLVFTSALASASSPAAAGPEAARPMPDAAPRTPAWDGPTLAWQTLGGTVGLGAGGLAGLLVTAGALKLRGGNGDGFADLGLAFLGAGAGAVIGTGVGTWLAGHWNHGTGGLGWTVLGSAAGVTSGMAIGSQIVDGTTGVLVGAVVLGITGSILGYHLSSSATAPSPLAAAVRVDTRGRVHLGAPLPVPVLDAGGRTRGWQVNLLSGRF